MVSRPTAVHWMIFIDPIGLLAGTAVKVRFAYGLLA
jgi:hypothetical protein